MLVTGLGSTWQEKGRELRKEQLRLINKGNNWARCARMRKVGVSVICSWPRLLTIARLRLLAESPNVRLSL